MNTTTRNNTSIIADLNTMFALRNMSFSKLFTQAVNNVLQPLAKMADTMQTMKKFSMLQIMIEDDLSAIENAPAVSEIQTLTPNGIWANNTFSFFTVGAVNTDSVDTDYQDLFKQQYSAIYQALIDNNVMNSKSDFSIFADSIKVGETSKDVLYVCFTQFGSVRFIVANSTEACIARLLINPSLSKKSFDQTEMQNYRMLVFSKFNSIMLKDSKVKPVEMMQVLNYNNFKTMLAELISTHTPKVKQALLNSTEYAYIPIDKDDLTV